VIDATLPSSTSAAASGAPTAPTTAARACSARARDSGPISFAVLAVLAALAAALGSGCSALGLSGDSPSAGGSAGEAGSFAARLPGENDGRQDPALLALDAATDAGGYGDGPSTRERGAASASASAWRTRVPPPPPIRFDPASAYYWTIRTDRGRMKFRLRPDLAPRHVASLLWLTRIGFYDGLTIHRVVPGFVLQGGCPFGDGRGGPGYRMAGEFHGRLGHDRPGILSSANAGPGTDGSQFFVTLQKAAGLDGRHTTFGELVEGEDTLRAIERLGSASGRPKRTVRIHEARASVAPIARLGSAPAGTSARPGTDGPGNAAVAGSAGAPAGAAGPARAPGARIVEEIDAFIAVMNVDRDDPRWRTRLPRPPRFVFPAGARYRWRLETSEGPIEVALRAFAAPMHASNLIYLTRLGFYDGLTLHRIVPGFVAQGGCPVGDGTGTPGYRFDLEKAGGRHDRRGLVGWANAGRPNTEGSQFYVTLGPAPHLDGASTIVGEVVAGEATLDAIERTAGGDGSPSREVRILTASIVVLGTGAPSDP